MEFEVQKLELTHGKIPFDDWYFALADTRIRAVISSRLTRMRGGNLGDVQCQRDRHPGAELPVAAQAGFNRDVGRPD